MKETLDLWIARLSIMVFIYLFFAFICTNMNPIEWHWFAKVIAVLLFIKALFHK